MVANKNQSHLLIFLKNIYSQYKLIYLISFGLICVLIIRQIGNDQEPLILAAGNNTGESYILSKAIAKVVKDKSGLDIKVCTTDANFPRIILNL